MLEMYRRQQSFALSQHLRPLALLGKLAAKNATRFSSIWNISIFSIRNWALTPHRYKSPAGSFTISLTETLISKMIILELGAGK
jgi:hypothetical protein